MKKKTAKCDPGCLNCSGGNAVFMAVSEDWICVACGGDCSASNDDKTRWKGPVEARLTELRRVAALYWKQVEVEDPLRMATLQRLHSIVDAIQGIERAAWPARETLLPPG